MSLSFRLPSSSRAYLQSKLKALDVRDSLCIMGFPQVHQRHPSARPGLQVAVGIIADDTAGLHVLDSIVAKLAHIVSPLVQTSGAVLLSTPCTVRGHLS